MAKGTKQPSRGTFIQQSRSKGSAEKAAYHDISGAGRRHVRRPFFSLTSEDEQALEDVFLKRLAAALNIQA